MYKKQGVTMGKRERFISTALERELPDLVFKNAKVVDVFCHQIRVCDVAVTDGYIVGLGNYMGKKEIQMDQKYLMPSFIDSHVHIESSMLTPAQYGKIVAAKGVTAVIADPHEIANVCGEEGLKYMLESGKNIPFDIYYMLPSCVPATPYDHNGAIIDGEQAEYLFKEYDFYGLGEVMDSTNVLSADQDMMKKFSQAPYIDGHAPLLSGKELCAYRAAGVMTDHECTNPEEMMEKISMGMYVQIREGSQAQNLKDLVAGINHYTLRRILFCTDDRYLGDIIEKGSISNCVRKAIEFGVDPIDAITIAALNPAECYGIKETGAIAPGYRANLIISKDLKVEHICQVYKDGALIAENGEALFEGSHVSNKKVRNSVHVKEIRAEDLQVAFTKGKPVIKVFPHTLYTEAVYPENDFGLNYCGVIERHGGKGEIGKGFIEGFQLKGGAIAQTIGHDSHNITVMGDNFLDMAIAVNALGKEGGMAVVTKGKVESVVSLPIAGLMSEEKAEDLLEQYKELKKAVEQLEINKDIDPFMMLAFLSLLVIPDIKISDSGVFDVINHKLY